LVVNAVIMRRTPLVTFLGYMSLTNGKQLQCWCFELKIPSHAKMPWLLWGRVHFDGKLYLYQNPISNNPQVQYFL